jgi:hypothetical protein
LVSGGRSGKWCGILEMWPVWLGVVWRGHRKLSIFIMNTYKNLEVENAVHKDIIGLAPNTTYYCRLTAYNANGKSVYSDVIEIKTSEDYSVITTTTSTPTTTTTTTTPTTTMPP